MQKKGLFIILILIAAVIHGYLYSADFEITANVDATKIGTEDLLIYTVRIKGNNNPNLPDLSNIGDFKIVQSRRGSEFSIINGSSSYYTNFTYYLSPKRTGQLKLNPVTYTYDGKTYKTRGFTIDVQKGKIKPSSRGRLGNRGLRSFFDDSFDDMFDHPLRRRRTQQSEVDVFLKTDISATELAKGEQLIYTIYLYTKNRITNVSLLSDQSFSGFFQEWKPISNQIEGTRKEYDGKIYQVFEIRKVALFPTKTGELTIPQLKFAINVYDPFSFSFSNSRKIFRTTKELKIRSRQIPGAEGLPVGSYRMELSVPKREVDINDILTVKLQISGVGNIKTLPVPEFEPNPYFKVFEPIIKRSSRFTDQGISGTINSEMTLNFKKKGVVSLPSLKIKLYDPLKGRVVDLKTKPVHVTVSGIKEKSDTAVVAIQKEIVKTKLDISYIRGGEIERNSIKYHQLKPFLLLLLLPFLVNLLYLLKLMVYDNYIKNSSILKKRKFFGQIQKQLAEITDYGEIHSVIESYFKHRIGVGFSELMNGKIEDFLQKKKIGESDIKKILTIKSESESARFSPQKKDASVLKADLKILTRILKKVETKI